MAGGVNMKKQIDIPLKVSGEIEYELEDTRTGEIAEEGKQKNLLLNDYLNRFFVEGRYHLGRNIFDEVYLGDSDNPADREQTGLQGSELVCKNRDSYDAELFELMNDGYWQTNNFTRYTRTIYTIDFHPDKNLALCGGLGNEVAIFAYDIQEGTATELCRFTGHQGPGTVSEAKFHPDPEKNIAMSGGSDGTARIWEYDIQEGTTTQLCNFARHTSGLLSVNFHPDPEKNLAISGGGDNTVKVWRYNIQERTTTEAISFTGHRNSIWSAKFHPDPEKNIAMSGSSDETVKIFAYHLEKENEIYATAEWIFEPGEGTGAIKEAVLRGRHISSIRPWVSRVVLDTPIEKKEYHRLKWRWKLVIEISDQVFTGTINEGQRDGSPIGYRIEILNHFLYNLFSTWASIKTFFAVAGTPYIELGSDNSLYDIQSYAPPFIKGESIENSAFTPFLVEPDPYVDNSFERTFRFGIEADEGNHADGLGEITLLGNDNTFMRITFDPPADKVNTYRFYVDVKFKLLPE